MHHVFLEPCPSPKFYITGSLFKTSVQPMIIAATSKELVTSTSTDDVFDDFIAEITRLYSQEDYIMIMDYSGDKR